MTMAEGYIPIIIAVVGFLSISIFCLGILQYARLQARKRATMERIQEGGKTTGILATYSSLETKRVGQSGIPSLLARIGRRIAGKKAADLSELRPTFLKAGIRWGNAVAVFWGTKVVLAVLLPVCFLVARVVFPGFMVLISNKVFVSILALTALGGFYLPNAWLRLKIAKRRETIRDSFPDALDLLTVCVEAGMGLDAAINRVAKEIELDSKILSDELTLMNLELRAGKSRRDALKNLAMRTDLEDVKSLVTLLIQADKLGTSVSQALRVYSDTFRTKRYMKAEEMAAKIPVKLTLPLILFIFPALLVTIMGPAFIQISRVLLPALRGGG